jgi:hypothetical protein
MASKTAPPQKNEFAGKPAVAVAQDAPKMATKSKIGGASLVPDIASRSESAGISRRYRYWVGVTPDCPRESIDLAGVNFPKINELIIPDPGRTSTKKRVPVIGSIVWLTEDKIRKMIERLPRTVVRYTSDEGAKEEPGTGQNVGDVHERPRKGHLITIPTDAEIEAKRLKGRSVRTYSPDPRRDVPAARFMFAQLCADQENGSRGHTYPDTLETAGIEWPDDLGIPSDEVS